MNRPSNRTSRAKRLRLGRRTFLRGGAGIAIALPWLEIMDPLSVAHAQAADDDLAYVVAMTGTSLVAGGDFGSPGPLVLPPAFTDFEDLRPYVSFVSGLEVPEGGSSSNPVAGGVNEGANHGTMLVPMITGHRHVGARLDKPNPEGASSDEYVADQIGHSTPFRSLHLRVQASNYGRGAHGEMSVRADGGRNSPISSPRSAYNTLFQGSSPTAPSDDLARGRSVLDVVLGRIHRLESELPSWDRERLQRHFDEIRELEKRLEGIPEGTCEVPGDPGEDPPISTLDLDDCANGNSACQSGWSNEDLRGDVMSTMLATALACRQTRVATYMIGWLSSYISMGPLFDVAWNAHDVTHGPFAAAVGASKANQVRLGMCRWFAGHFAELLTKLRDLPEGDGNVLDRTVAVLLWEHGTRAHDRRDLTLTIAGAPDRLVHDQHIDGGGQHPSRVLQTAMAAVGVERDFGAAPGIIPGLLP
ncbi:MAG: DUF1552 domain-containing protein [Myxococcota bacterium]